METKGQLSQAMPKQIYTMMAWICGTILVLVFEYQGCGGVQWKWKKCTPEGILLGTKYENKEFIATIVIISKRWHLYSMFMSLSLVT